MSKKMSPGSMMGSIRPSSPAIGGRSGAALEDWCFPDRGLITSTRAISVIPSDGSQLH